MNRYEVQNGMPLVERLADLIAERREIDRLGRITVVVPSIYSAVYLRRALVRELVRRGSGLFNVAFERIEDVSDEILRTLPGSDDVRQMSRIVASEIILNALSNLSTSGYLGRAVNKHRFVDSIRTTLHDLERLPSGAREALTQLIRSNASPIYAELLEIYDFYSARAQGWLTRAQLAERAAEVVRKDASELADVIGAHCILLVPHSEFDTHIALWRALSELEVSVSMVIVPRDETEVRDQIDWRFYSTLSAVDAPRQLLRNVMEDARSGIKFGDMAVFVPDMGSAVRLRAAFHEAGIPLAGQSPRGLSSTLTAKFVLHVLDAMLKDLRRDSVMAWLTSSPVVSPKSGTTVSSTRWDYIARSAKVSTFAADSDWQRRVELHRSSLAYQIRRLETNPDIDDETVTVSLSSLQSELTNTDGLSDFVDDLLRDVADGQRVKTWAGHVEWLESVISRYLTHDAKDADSMQGMARVRSLLESINQLDDVIGDGPDNVGASIPFPRFAEAVRSAINGVAGRRSGLGRGVLITEIDAGFASTFARVHVMGLSETAYQSGGTDHPMLRDGDRNMLNEGEVVLPTVKSRQDAARRAFELAVSSSRHCRFYWNRSQIGDSSDSFPSPLYLERLSLVTGRTVTAEDAMAGNVPEIEEEPPLHEAVLSAQTAWEPYGARLASLTDARRSPGEVPNLSGDAPLAKAWMTYSNRIGSGFTAHDGDIGAMREYLAGFATSASRLESYARCPYSYFLAEVLGVEAQPDVGDEFGLSPLDRGQLVHEILDSFVKERRGMARDAADDALFARICDAVFADFESRSFAPPAALWDLEKRFVVRNLTRWRSAEREVMAGVDGESLVEVQFGYGGGAPVVVPVQLADGTELEVAFRGRIDRIAFDSDRNSVVVTDYKTGSGAAYSGLNQDEVDRGMRLQLPIYMLAASRMYPDVLPDLMRGFFWFVFASDRNNMLAPRAGMDWRSVAPRLHEVLRTITRGIAQGEFPVRPGRRDYSSGNWESCRNCAFDAACDSGRAAVWDRKRASVPTEYVAMVEPGELSE